MSQTTLRLTATADTTDAERKLDNLQKQTINLSEEIANKNRERLKEAVGLVAPVAIGVQQVIKLVDWAVGKVQELIARAANFREAYAKTGDDLATLAKNLGATTAEAIRLQAAADAAGVKARDYADALDKIKAGQTTLADQAAQWETIADSATLAQSRATQFAAAIASAQKRRESAIGLAEQTAASIAGLGLHGEIASTFIDQILAGRTDPITGKEYLDTALRQGRTAMSLGRDPAALRTAIDALNQMIAEQNAQRAQQRAAAQQAQNAQATATLRLVERLLAANGGDLDDAIRRAARIQNQTIGQTRDAYGRGYALLSPEERELRALREQAAAQSEQERAQAKQDALGNYTGQFGTNAAATDQNGAPLQTVSAAAAALRWALTEGGGLLAGVNYGFGLAQKDPAKQIADTIQTTAKTINATLTSIDKTLKDD